jgi:hypothetical protein
VGLEACDGKARDLAREKWLVELHAAALALFDAFVDVSADLAAPDLRRAVLARRNLVQFTRPSFPKLRKCLGLLVEESAKPAKGAKSRRPTKESTP